MNFYDYYGDGYNVDVLKPRLAKLLNAFRNIEGVDADFLFSSPGRAEILGNHTDHNHGKVLVASISCDILAAVKKTDDNQIKICSEGYSPIIIDLADTTQKQNEKGTSSALARGVAHAIKDRGFTIGGFTAFLTSNVFKGAGVSSSAAFEVLVAEIFNVLYLDGRLSAVDKAVISQYSENVYFGKPCGLLDQCGIAIGSLSALDFCVPTNPTIQKYDMPKGYSLVITNTGGDHASLTSHYAAIRSEMESVAGVFGKKVLREVDYRELLDNIPLVRKSVCDRAVLRAMHFFEENERVERACLALKDGNVKGFLNAVNESGLSSLIRLQNCSVPSELSQPVVLGIELSRNIIKDGAVRVHGGGFAGSILAIVSDGERDFYVSQMEKVFGKENVFTAHVRPTGTAKMA
ncbi:MAG: galactokinase [Clostridia bacterium]|nr:galactokinase [Clostridia bacterium]